MNKSKELERTRHVEIFARYNQIALKMHRSEKKNPSHFMTQQNKN